MTTETRVLQHVNAARADVYRALLDPDAVARWMVPAGMSCHVHGYDAREGGRFRVTLSYHSPEGAGKTTAQTDTYHGRFVKLVPDQRVEEVMEFETDAPAMRGEMRVTFTLADAGAGTDVLALHENVPPGVPPADNETGWRMALENLARLLDPGAPQRSSTPGES